MRKAFDNIRHLTGGTFGPPSFHVILINTAYSDKKMHHLQHSVASTRVTTHTQMLNKEQVQQCKYIVLTMVAAT